MITKEIVLVERVLHPENNTQSFIAELRVYVNGEFKWHDSRSPYTFSQDTSDEDIIRMIKSNDYAKYFMDANI